MLYAIDAACLCNTGKIRKNNEDNYYFDGEFLESDNTGLDHPLITEKKLVGDISFAVFDGMGGEDFGEIASYTAAIFLKNHTKSLRDCLKPREKYLNDLCLKINESVVEKEKELMTERMGSTLVLCCFSRNKVYACNLGDSRVYRLRNSAFIQLSMDHVEKREGEARKKAPLTQHLGIDPERYLLEPHIMKEHIEPGDQFLLCSDGLTDMLTDSEICEIMLHSQNARESVQQLIDAALEKGGKDNVTAIVCRIRESTDNYS